MGQYFSHPPLPPSQEPDLLGPNAFMTLPPEIFNEILGYVQADWRGRRALIACALVASWWTGPSQRRLFSSVLINERNHKRWVDSVVHSRSKSRLLAYVLSLRHGRGPSWGVGYQMRDLPPDSGEYLSDMHNIHTLTLSRIKVEPVNEEGLHCCFSAFRRTLTYLSLDVFATSFNTFVTLVDYFPNLKSLHLRSFWVEPDEGPVPPLSRPLRGGIHFHDLSPRGLEFFDRFAKLDLEYEELVVNSTTSTETRLVEGPLQISPSTVKFLRLTFTSPCA